MSDELQYLAQAVAAAAANVQAGGRPFGAVVVSGGTVIATAVNEIHRSHDVTDHAELLALRAAARSHGPKALQGAAVYASGHPCPMCMAAMRLAGVASVTYAHSNEDGAPFNLSTAALAAELRRPFAEQSMVIRHQPLTDAPGPSALYQAWAAAQNARI